MAQSRDVHVRASRVVHEKRRDDHTCPHCNSRFGKVGDMRKHCPRRRLRVRKGSLTTHINHVHLKIPWRQLNA